MTNITNLQSFSSSIHAVASPFDSYLNDLYDKYQSLNEGTIANYIPELELAESQWFGISVVTTDNQIFEVGDCERFFTIQSISKVLVYGLALEDHGRDNVDSKVSVEPSGEAFNSIILDRKTNRPYNPMVNAGAIATTDLIKGNGSTERLKRILNMFRRYTGREHEINVPVYSAEKATGHRNRAIAYLMLNFGMINEHLEETLDLYFQQCSIMVNARDLAMISATLANGGINPITKERAIDERYVQDLISVMFTCGMYDYSGEWTYRVGIPAKSGVSGGISAVVPGKLGIGTFSPLLDAKGNSVRGIKVCEDMSRDFGLHLFNVAKPERILKDWIEGNDMSKINCQPVSITFSQSLRRNLTPNSTLQELQSVMDYFQIDISLSGEELYGIFKENPLLIGAILNKKDKFVGMISRHDFLETISRQYGRDIFLKRPLESLISFVKHEVLILPANTLIFKAVKQCIQRHSQPLYEPIVVKFHDENYKLLDTQQLLMTQNYIYELCMKTLAERNKALDQANLGIAERNYHLSSYIHQVKKVTAVAAAVENDTYEPEHLSQVAARSDELGQMARVFQRMIQAVRTREREVELQLKRQLQELQIEIDQQKRNKEVAEIIQSDYFQVLQQEAELLQFNDENW